VTSLSGLESEKAYEDFSAAGTPFIVERILGGEKEIKRRQG